ncbi:MAG TPA: DUF2127 domain-containing protein, partial [Candidatus Acidoferrum sp.]|nr:DUF2127 domain-containing protein [Candidatus Acidoferrum sp.]
FFVGGMASRLASLAAEGNSIQNFLSGFGRFISMALLIYAAIILVLGFGLLFSQAWARTLTIIFSALGFLILLPRMFHHHPFSILIALLNLGVLIYLLLPDTRAYFDRKRAREIIPS